MRIAIIEDNKTLAKGIAHLLRDEGHAVDEIHNGTEALEFLVEEAADIIVLDINLPGLSGLEVLKGLRKAGKQTPVILLTALGETKDRVAGLDAGADDYLVKPFEMDELNARIRALLRRKQPELLQARELGPFSYDRAKRSLSVNGTELALPKKELATFECFFDRPNQVVAKATLANHLYGVGADVEEKVVEVYVSRLRKRLSNYGVEFKTARGLGYLMKISE